MTASQLMGLAEKYARAYHKWHGEDMEEGDHKRLEEARAALYDALVAAGVAIPFAACGECRTADLCAEGGCAVKNCPPEGRDQPVAWRDVHDHATLYFRKPEGYEVEPLYLAPGVRGPDAAEVDQGVASVYAAMGWKQEPAAGGRVVDGAEGRSE